MIHQSILLSLSAVLCSSINCVQIYGNCSSINCVQIYGNCHSVIALITKKKHCFDNLFFFFGRLEMQKGYMYTMPMAQITQPLFVGVIGSLISMLWLNLHCYISCYQLFQWALSPSSHEQRKIKSDSGSILCHIYIIYDFLMLFVQDS